MPDVARVTSIASVPADHTTVLVPGFGSCAATAHIRFVPVNPDRVGPAPPVDDTPVDDVLVPNVEPDANS